MKFYLAPMEGITTYTYRNTVHKYFDHIDKYYTPFIVATQNLRLKNNEKRDICFDHNQGLYVVPQILSNNADTLIWAIAECQRLGYHEVNLNLGCPSPTVVTKRRGSGMLGDLNALDEMLDRTFKMMPQGMSLSIKTRLGIEDTSHTRELMHLYNKYPLSELIIHPRCTKDYYKKPVHLDDFALALQESNHEIVYNGNILDVYSYKQFHAQFPQVKAVMMGRGLIADPDLVHQIQTGEVIDKEVLLAFLMELFDLYKVRIDGVRNTLMKMKELWFYLQSLFIFEKKDLKKILKARTEEDYKAAVTYFITVSEIDPREKRNIHFR